MNALSIVPLNWRWPLIVLAVICVGAASTITHPDLVLVPLVDEAGVTHWLSPNRVEEVIEYEAGFPKAGGQQSLVRMANGVGTLYPIPPVAVVGAVETAWASRYSAINAADTDR